MSIVSIVPTGVAHKLHTKRGKATHNLSAFNAYIRKGENGELAEIPEEMLWQIAFHIAKVEAAQRVN